MLRQRTGVAPPAWHQPHPGGARGCLARSRRVGGAPGNPARRPRRRGRGWWLISTSAWVG
eukprot:6903827-Pyramimonas_sp.AAC.1